MVSHGVFSWGYVALAAVSLVVCLLMVLGLRLQDGAVMEPSRSYCTSHIIFADKHPNFFVYFRCLKACLA